MPALTLTPDERRRHRADAHHLHPVVQIGNDGLTPAVVDEAGRALSAHGLIKVRVANDDRAARDTVFAALADQLGAAPVQHIGKLLVLWRPLPPKEAVAREGRGSGARTVKVVSFSKSGNHRATVRKVTVLGNERLSVGGLIKRANPPRAGSKKKSGS